MGKYIQSLLLYKIWWCVLVVIQDVVFLGGGIYLSIMLKFRVFFLTLCSSLV